MKLQKVILILCLTALSGTLVAFITYNFFYVKHVQTINMSVIVGDHIGFDAGTESLTFGMAIPGASSTTRTVFIDNMYDYPVQLVIKKEGEMGTWVVEHVSNYTIQPHTKESAQFSATVPLGIEPGLYDGKIKFIFKRKLKK